MNKELLTLLMIVSFAPSLSATDIYVSPNGSEGATGSQSKPYSLLAVCKNRALAPGTTVNMLSGIYKVTPKSIPKICWQGTEDKRIVLRSAPGHWAVIDGRLDLNVPSAYITLRDFEITRTSDVNVNDPNWWNLPVRQRPSYGGRGNLKFAMGDQLIVLSNTRKAQLINIYAHDNISGGGLGAWNAATDTLVYGCIFVRNGWDDSRRGHGHGCYIQNGHPKRMPERLNSKKLFRHNITGYNYSTGMKAYGEGPEVRGCHFEGNTFFCNGLLSQSNGSANFLAGTRNLLDDIVLRDNFFYQPDSVTGDVGGTIYLGWGRTDKGKCVFTGNHVYGGGSSAVRVQFWRDLTFTNNTIYDNRSHAKVTDHDSRMKSWKWDKNTYHDNGQPNSMNGRGFKQWQSETGFDKKSRYLPNKPQRVQTHVTLNEYDKNRARVVVYNWSRDEKVSFNPSKLLKRGDNYVVYNVLDYRGKPAAKGTYRRGRIKVKTLEYPNNVGREFQVFVLHKNVKKRR